jgi:ligand-binding sensor domain-containing protein
MTGGRAGGRTGRWLVGFIALTACAVQSVRPSARLPAPWGPDNRVLISDFSDVQALAASTWFVFAATTHGLLVYDRVARRFRLPVTALDGYPTGRRVRRAIADPAGNAVWLDLGAGAGYVRYDLDGRGWTPGALPPERTGTLSVEAALASAPLADALRAAILTDGRLRVHQFTAAAATPERPEIFFGTNGLGIIRVDKQTGEWEVLTYGLLAPSVGALAAAADGIWAATNVRPGAAGRVGGVGGRRGLTWVARDLAKTRTSEGGRAALGFSFLSARSLITAADQLWLATEQGVLRVDAVTFESRLWDLPDATCLALGRGGIWVGTTDGLSLITADERVQNFGPGGLAITSLLAVNETLWVGTNAGLAQLPPHAEAIATPAELGDRPGLRVPVYALARLQDTIVMATERELLWRDPATRVWTAVPLPLTLGIPTALAPGSGGGLWIGGTHGLAQADITSRLIHVHVVPFEVPAAVRDLASDRSFLWAATDSGLMRIQ